MNLTAQIMATSLNIHKHLDIALKNVGASRLIKDYEVTLMMAIAGDVSARHMIKNAVYSMYCQSMLDKNEHCKSLIRESAMFDSNNGQTILEAQNTLRWREWSASDRAAIWPHAKRAMTMALDVLHESFVRQQHFIGAFPEIYAGRSLKGNHMKFDLYRSSRAFERCCEYTSKCDIISIQNHFAAMTKFFSEYVAAFSRAARELVVLFADSNAEWALQGLEALSSDAFENQVQIDNRQFHLRPANVFTMLDALHTIIHEL